MADPTAAPYAFPLDPFQREAIAALDAGQSVLVAAPTGAGKTVIAEHAVQVTIDRGDDARIFYTTPIKALSNQKYADLVRRHGTDAVGLLTGDNAVNGEAPIVVMTTEVLRNMIYGASPALDHLQFVVLDEVHYLQDAYRGPVWEEVMIHLPARVRLVCLSATVSNAHELADWIATIRGPTATIIEHERPVELANLYLVGDRETDTPVLLPTLLDGRPNPEGDQFDAERVRSGPRRGRPRRRYYTPRRLEVVDELVARTLLPAIYFIFSRAACDDAAANLLGTGLRLTSATERERIAEIVDQRVAPLTDDDLGVLGYARFRAGLDAGIAAHHAGMVPPFKEAVEACFVEGLVKVVFATETLALGINMPARTVVIEKLSKFTGEHHELLTPGQYTQITGRAGRRGIDDIGHAIVLWSPFVSFGQVAGLAASRTFELSSAFRPTYNMAANLVRRYPPDQAHHLLNLSFAQYRADRDVVRLERRLEKRSQRVAELRAEARCDRGDIEEYRALLPAPAPRRRSVPRGMVEAGLAALHPGDVIPADGHERVLVLSVAHRQRGAVRVRAITTGRKVLTLGANDFTAPPAPVGHIELPVPYAPNNDKFRRAAADELRRAAISATHRAPGRATPPGPDDRGDASVDHPVAGCPDLEAHLAAAKRADRVAREVADIEGRVRGRTESLARQFDRVLTLLEAWGHLDGWQLTRRGDVLARIYHESDLLIAESLATGALDGLDPAALAGLVSCFTYEHRSAAPPPPPWFPSGRVRERFGDIERLAAALNADEHDAGIPLTRPPDAGFCALAHAWAAGEPLDEVLDDEDLSGGDFVRNAKQLIDLLRQIGDVAPEPATARTARAAADTIFRGVVAASSVVGEGTPA